MPTVYDELPYPGGSYTQTHPDRLATLGILFGMTPAPVESCRVLELGCGDGGNLIPMAFNLPGSSFTGIDLSATAISRGLELIAQLGLANIHIQQLDLMDMNTDSGEYDHIIAHGLYSWVPPVVRERVLETCKSQLAPNGVAFISYNAYPGGHLHDTVLEMMRFHTRHVTDAREKVRQSRELLEFLVEAHPENDVYRAILQAELQSCLERKPAFFYHDELAEHNHRFYFHEFVKDAARHGLQFLSEALLSNTGSNTFSQYDDLSREQYLDFLELRAFRQSLLCHAEIGLKRNLDPAPVTRLSAASEAQPVSSNPDIRSDAAEEFRHPRGGKTSTNHPLAKAAMLHLSRVWPQSVPFQELLQIARMLSERASSDDDSAWLSNSILKLYVARLVELHLYTPAFVTEVSERPLASALARAQMRTSQTLSNLRYGSVEIGDETARQLLLLLDGTRDRKQLLAKLQIMPEQLEINLKKLARLALLAT
jgi:SAM-dependent methyltransferase/methyltransferase-like protein